MISLLPDQTHLWITDDSVHNANLYSQYRQMLSPQEKMRHKRLWGEENKNRFLITRALVRNVLSNYETTAPAEWQFENNDFGKPHISWPKAFLPLHFNLSHTKGLIVCAVTRAGDVGIDVENLNRNVDFKVITRFFSPQEVSDFQVAHEPTGHFFALWTLKEAYIKACGKGLAIPLDSFSFSFPQSGEPKLTIHDGQKHSSNCSNKFFLYRYRNQFPIALCLQTKNGNVKLSHSITFYSTVPLQEKTHSIFLKKWFFEA